MLRPRTTSDSFYSNLETSGQTPGGNQLFSLQIFFCSQTEIKFITTDIIIHHSEFTVEEMQNLFQIFLKSSIWSDKTSWTVPRYLNIFLIAS